MKYKRILLLLLFVLLMIVSANIIKVNAMNTGFSTEELSEETKKNFVSYVGITLLRTEPVKSAIVCFDVNEQGMIVVGEKEGDEKKICVYTSHGEFLYGYTFYTTYTGSFAVEWDGQRINLVYREKIVSLDSDGNILDIKSVLDTADNRAYYKMLQSSKRTVNDTTYVIRNDMGIFNWIAKSFLHFSQIVIIDAEGTEFIIYDVNSMQLGKIIVSICIGILISICFACAVNNRDKQFVKRRNNSQLNDNNRVL